MRTERRRDERKGRQVEKGKGDRLKARKMGRGVEKIGRKDMEEEDRGGGRRESK